MAGVRAFWRAGIVLLLAAAIAMPIVGQQQQKKTDNPFEQNKAGNLVKELGILDSGYRTGKVAESKGNFDHYYFDTPESEWIPDEFMSNPDPKIDFWHLKGYHLPPRIKEVKIVGPKTYKPGDTVKFECVVFNKYKVNAFQLNYHGPNGRRTESYAEFRGQPKETWKEGDMLYQRFEGTLKLSKWAEPGTYLALAIQNLNNELGHGKSYRSDYLPEMDRTALAFEVADNPNIDVVAPTLKTLVLGSLDGTPAKQPYTAKITDLIPVYAEADDNKSGVNEVVVTLASPTRRYSDVTLQPMLDKPNAFVGYFRVNRWYEGGDYWISRVQVKDAAGNERFMFPQSTPFLQAARVTLAQDNADMNPPKLITLNLDKENAKPGETIKVSAIVVDDKSGVGEVVATIHSPSAIDKKRVVLRPKNKPPIMIKPAYDVQENILEGTFTIGPDDEPGAWTLKRVVARDLANNYLDMVSTTYPQLEKLQVTFAEVKAGTAPVATPAAAEPAAAGQPQKIRRVDMTPPHPPRGPCLNCHEPQY